MPPFKQDSVSAQRVEQDLAVHTFVRRHGFEDGVERSDAQRTVIWN